MEFKEIKILVFVPYFFKQGGIALFFKSLMPHFDGNYSYFFRGNKSSTYDKLAFYYYFLDYISFFRELITKKNDFFILNTSLAKSGCYRDAVFILLLKLFKKKFIVFFHGWDKNYEKKIDAQKQPKPFPINQFKKAQGIVVLATDFKTKLRDWGFHQPVFLGRTVVEESLLKGYTNDVERFTNTQCFTFLFLARVEKTKGVIEAINIFESIQKSNPDSSYRLLIAGNGSYLNNVKKFVRDRGIFNVDFLGHIEGDEKRNAFIRSHFFLFPSYTEGMPLSVLEAMAFGLPVLTTSVGGLKDFFVDKKMGVLIDNPFEEKAVGLVDNLIKDKKKLMEMSEFNYKYANENFNASVVAKDLVSFFHQMFYFK
jgi:glycosyltransferase involved in cell wall biosynthesis